VGLLWPASNHTVAVWVLHPSRGPVIRIVVPTTQIFLNENDFFDTRKFDPWRQKTIYASCVFTLNNSAPWLAYFPQRSATQRPARLSASIYPPICEWARPSSASNLTTRPIFSSSAVVRSAGSKGMVWSARL